MSGPGIRYWEFARVLSDNACFDVTLATTPDVSFTPLTTNPLFGLHSGRDEADLRTLAAHADAVVAPGPVADLYPSLTQNNTPLVLDLYIPLLLEELQRPRSESLAEQELLFDRIRRSMCSQLLAADFIICASEKQRDFWLGALSALGRVNPYTHASDPTLECLVAVVPFGLPTDPPRHTRQVLKGAHPSIDADDKVLLWSGGIWDWLDTSTLLRAMARLVGHRPDIKLFFMGIKHFNPQEAQRKGTRETLALADELDLTNRTVFFNDWVPYEERGNYLLEADMSISLHRDHLESRFSFRTRFLDNLWAGLPLIATRGDVLSREIKHHGLGHLVEPGDVDGVVEAILNLADTPDSREVYRSRFKRLSDAYRWEVVTQPLIQFCTDPHFAPDKQHLGQQAPMFRTGPTSWWQLPGKAWQALQKGGLQNLVRQMRQYLRWMLNRQGMG